MGNTNRDWLRVTKINGVGYLREVLTYGHWYAVGIFATEQEARR